jgi:undecaprenyl-diphosphatase
LLKLTLFGITQGLTEFLPVSSSGHLYILKRILGSPQNYLSFFILLHIATLLVIVLVLKRQVWLALINKNLLIYLATTTLVTCIIGFLIDRFLKASFDNKYFISLCLMVNALILLRIKNIKGQKDRGDFKLKDALTLGVLQGLAIFPGISRAGITISSLLKRGFKPQEAFSLSFLMAIPAILAAFIFKYLFHYQQLSQLHIPWTGLSLGFLAAFCSGFIALLIVKKTLITHKFRNFGYYCFGLSLLGLLL